MLLVIIILLRPIYANSCTYEPRTTELNLGVKMGKTKTPSFSRRVGKSGSSQKVNRTISSKVCDEITSMYEE